MSQVVILFPSAGAGGQLIVGCSWPPRSLRLVTNLPTGGGTGSTNGEHRTWRRDGRTDGNVMQLWKKMKEQFSR